MLCAADNHNYMCHICAKGFLDSDFNEALINKISNFQELALISHVHKNHNFFKSIIEKRKTNCFYPKNFLAGTCKESTFSFLPVVNC